MYSICHAYIQYVCSIIPFPRLSGYICGKRMCAVMRGLTVAVSIGYQYLYMYWCFRIPGRIHGHGCYFETKVLSSPDWACTRRVGVYRGFYGTCHHYPICRKGGVGRVLELHAYRTKTGRACHILPGTEEWSPQCCLHL